MGLGSRNNGRALTLDFAVGFDGRDYGVGLRVHGAMIRESVTPRRFSLERIIPPDGEWLAVDKETTPRRGGGGI